MVRRLLLATTLTGSIGLGVAVGFIVIALFIPLVELINGLTG